MDTELDCQTESFLAKNHRHLDFCLKVVKVLIVATFSIFIVFVYYSVYR